MAYSLHTDSFLNALRRFISRRGNVKLIGCDNGTNIRSGQKEISDALKTWNQSQIGENLLLKDIQWKYQPPSASHFGGVFEREIRSFRKVLNSILKEQPKRLSDELLLTLLCEIESILNSRPLSEQSEDSNDFEAITPNHLLLLHSGATYPSGFF